MLILSYLCVRSPDSEDYFHPRDFSNKISKGISYFFLKQGSKIRSESFLSEDNQNSKCGCLHHTFGRPHFITISHEICYLSLVVKLIFVSK